MRVTSEIVPGPETSSSPTWLERETARLHTDSPRLAAGLQHLAERPALVLLPLAVVILGTLGAVVPGGDAEWFRIAGLSMLGPRLLDVFGAPGLQIGPLYLLSLGAATAATDWLPEPSMRFVLAAGQGALVLAYALAVTRRAASATGARALPAQWAVGLALVLGGLLAESVGNGHPEEILLGLLLAHAALEAARARPRTVGVLLALAVAVKIWGVLGAPVALVGRRPRTVVVAGAVGGLLAALVYGPFFLWGDVQTFSFSWGIPQETVLARVVGPEASDWGLRVAQAGVAVATGAAVALRRAGSPLTVVLAVIGTRLLLDPLFLTYYAGPFLVVALLWAWTSNARPGPALRAACWSLVPTTVLVPYLLDRTVSLVTLRLVVVVVAVVALILDRRATRPGLPVLGGPDVVSTP
ncbi:glycosyltransferase 87 family protein [Cellulomonas cellasea]|uniref:DUF2029 domain-containing protein n=2 Tax=Cellulomonas cellasea TaxID=43670 RepID=A0A0A0B7R7_9CELL|nr:glycosyltransferase 87 family protein [Cellulomonas cellasea]KGM02900.1 hypothetical protein Q760_10770 [Cellulomonas cellasea DSM 20118]GEA88800.1 hypothetical protein CCE01nite_27490 [Cellulomonas cellasea]